MSKTFLLKAASAIQSDNLAQDQITTITNYVNRYRAMHQAPPLTYDPTISVYAQKWSDYLLSNNLFQHSGSNLYSENLAYFQNYGSDSLDLIQRSVKAWYDEVSLYDFVNSTFSSKSGHFSALVWKASTSYGIGYSFNPDTNTAIVSFNFSPMGNIVGQFKANVLPLITSVTPPTPVTPVPTPEPTPTVVPTPTTPPLPTTDNTVSSTDMIENIMTLYKILNYVNNNKPKEIIMYEIKQLIKKMAAQ